MKRSGLKLPFADREFMGFASSLWVSVFVPLSSYKHMTMHSRSRWSFQNQGLYFLVLLILDENSREFFKIAFPDTGRLSASNKQCTLPCWGVKEYFLCLGRFQSDGCKKKKKKIASSNTSWWQTCKAPGFSSHFGPVFPPCRCPLSFQQALVEHPWAHRCGRMEKVRTCLDSGMVWLPAPRDMFRSFTEGLVVMLSISQAKLQPLSSAFLIRWNLRPRGNFSFYS